MKFHSDPSTKNALYIIMQDIFVRETVLVEDILLKFLKFSLIIHIFYYYFFF